MAIVLNHPKISDAHDSGKDVDMPIGDSSFLQNVSYDSKNQQMTVTMRNGGQYVYSSISKDVAQDFMESKDKGRFYTDTIKNNYPSQRTVNKTVGKAVKK